MHTYIKIMKNNLIQVIDNNILDNILMYTMYVTCFVHIMHWIENNTHER